MANVCAGCLQNIDGKEHLLCSFCNNIYDLECANVSLNHFYKVMTETNKKSWKCHGCRSKIPKVGNTDTPVGAHSQRKYQQVTTPSEENNVTIRKRTTYTFDDSSMCGDVSGLGDTLFAEENQPCTANLQTQISLQNLSDIIMMRLKENNESIIVELRKTIQSEIQTTIAKLTREFEQKANFLTKQNEERKTDIQQINNKIENLIKENDKLKNEILGIKSRTTTPTITTTTQCVDSNSKKIVLYGFTEYFKEPENNLHDRLVNMFWEIMQVDLTGYIENFYRLGKNASITRPLVIEFLSKRTTKYLLNNSKCFQGTRLSVSEYLDERARKQRHQMREELIKARKNQLHAVIRNNQLYIEGKRVSLHEDNTIIRQELEDMDKSNQTQSESACNTDHNQTNKNKYSFRKSRRTI